MSSLATESRPSPAALDRRSFCLGVGAAALAVPARAQVASLNDAIDKAGRQRMLSQRLMKCYMSLGQQIMASDAERILAASMALFDRQLVELKAYSPTADIRGTYGQLESAWSDYKAALVGAKPSKAGAEQVSQQAARVLALAHQGTGQLEAVSGKPLGRLVNISGRQRMLSQRMAAMYLASSWGSGAIAAAAEIQKARSEFTEGLSTLNAAPQATEAIKRELDLAAQQWAFFDGALRTLKPGQAVERSMGEVFTSSERILQVMDQVTGMFARAA